MLEKEIAMPELPPRPTWKLGEEVLPASYPPLMLDPDAAFAAALEADAGHDRCSDVSDVLKAALCYSAESMRGGFASLAFNCQSRTIKAPSGWMALHGPGPSKSSIDIVLLHPDEPGAWHVAFHFNEVMIPAAAAREEALSREVRQARLAAGATPREAMLAEILGALRGGKVEKTPLEQELDALRRDPMSYRSAAPGDVLRQVDATALVLGPEGWRGTGKPGHPTGTEASDCVSADAFLPLKKHPQTWWPGMQFSITPQSRFERMEEQLRPRSDCMGGCAHIPMTILSDLIRAGAQHFLVARANEDAGAKSWVCFGSECTVRLQDAGMAAVAASGGFFDSAVSDRLRDFSAAIAAKDVERNLEDWVSLAPRLVEHGFTDAANRFDCNDMDDFSFAACTGDLRRVVLETQHGLYQIDMELDREGGVSRVEAGRILKPDVSWDDPDRDEKRAALEARALSSFEIRPVGRFRMTEDGLQADYGAGPDGAAEIDYTIRNIRDMNGIIASLSSTCCCFDEEHPQDPDRDDPCCGPN